MAKRKSGIKGEMNKKAATPLGKIEARLDADSAEVAAVPFNTAEDTSVREALLRLPKGVVGKPYPLDPEMLRRMRDILAGDVEAKLTNPMVFTDADIRDAREGWSKMPVPSMMTAKFNGLPRASDPDDRKKFLMSDPGMGKTYMKQLLDRKPKG